MSKTSQLTVVSAAAGTGKTTRLVQEYLDLLRDGISPNKIVAITFTRKAAAELIESVSRCLRNSLGEPVPEKFKQDFDACYKDHLPTDLDLIRNALNELPNAPAGTTDSFVQRLLSEFALEARLPVDDDGPPAWLDFPIGQGDTSAVFEMAIREVIDPQDGKVPPAASALLKHMGMKELLAHISETARALPLRDAAKGIELASGTELMKWVLSMVANEFRTVKLGNPEVTQIKLKANSEFERPVLDWVQDNMPAKVPMELIAWCAITANGSIKEPAQALKAALAQKQIDFGIVSINLNTLAQTFAKGFSESQMQICDSIRSNLLTLSEQVRNHAFRMAAQTGALDHDLLTEAAIDLCSRADRSDRLQNRFEAILLDEVQDSSPRQFRLFEALENLPGEGKRLRAFYVGDSRQSIYLFRGAEPAGLGELEKRPELDGTKREQLGTNFRSTPAMVEAQKALFARAKSGIDTLPGLSGVTGIDHVKSVAGKAKDQLTSEAPFQDPVVIVTRDPDMADQTQLSPKDLNCAAIDVFAARIQDAWTREKRTNDTAAVLTTSWPKAIATRDRLRAILRPNRVGDAFLDGNSELTKRQVARDVRLIIQALWDSTDDIAWAGLWRLPMIGLSDGALAALKTGTGLHPTESRIQGLSWATAAESLSPEVFPEADVMAFQRVRPILTRAGREIGRIPTADVIERMAADLHWRPILLAGPDGMDAVGELEVILDWIRQTESDQVDPDAVVALLDPDQSEDPPRVELHRDARTVSCTTIFQAKGLKYDHVLVYDIGTSPGGNADEGWSRASVKIDKQAKTLLGVKFDPDGALKPVPDPLQLLADQVNLARRNEERLRLAYVAITRAVRSVTFAVGVQAGGIHKQLSALWTAEPAMPGITQEPVEAPAKIDGVRKGFVSAKHGFPVDAVEPSGWVSVSPSSAGEAWKSRDLAARDALVADIAKRCEFLPGGDPIAPPTIKGETADSKVEDASWGTLVHHWMEFGGLNEGADLAMATRFLSEKYDMVHPELAEWLVKLVRNLESKQSDLITTLRSPEVTLHHEMPFAGVNATVAGDPWFHAGRIDLLVTWPDRRAWVIDFKAGSLYPASREDLIQDRKLGEHGPKLNEHGPQLEAYRQALTSAGWNVEKVGLLFMRTGTWVGW
jgi:ATP-dependent exoDNAse (exonuclease V) beta subunit